VFDRPTVRPRPRPDLALLSALLLGAAPSCPAQDAARTGSLNLPEVVIQAKRQAADEQVTRQVQQTLTNDPWIYYDHITVTTQNGVVTLEGIVGDTGEMFRIVRLCRKITGARRVVKRARDNAQRPGRGIVQGSPSRGGGESCLPFCTGSLHVTR
jgi:hypothetical protein